VRDEKLVVNVAIHVSPLPGARRVTAAAAQPSAWQRSHDVVFGHHGAATVDRSVTAFREPVLA
jgi:hypothetical protein